MAAWCLVLVPVSVSESVMCVGASLPGGSQHFPSTMASRAILTYIPFSACLK